MSIRYKDAGVDVERGYETVRRIRRSVSATHGPEVLTDLGGFGGLFAPDLKGIHEPVLVSGTDGVGTKLKLAFSLDRHDSIGIDCVAMCVNDVICTGAKPLFFLDYIATGHLLPEQVERIVAGIAAGCRQSGAALIGGETAEMPGFYPAGEYDVAGFCVGLVDRSKIIDGSRVASGDILLGIPSSGVHSNGFSLVRRLFPEARWREPFGSSTLGETLLTPTRIYVREVAAALTTSAVKGIAHITGGGFIENIPRMFAEDLAAEIQPGNWPVPAIFEHLQREAEASREEMFNTFNMGIGLVLAVGREHVDQVRKAVEETGSSIYPIGRIRERQGDAVCFA